MHTYPLVGRLRGYYLADYVESICVRRIVKDGTPLLLVLRVVHRWIPLLRVLLRVLLLLVLLRVLLRALFRVLLINTISKDRISNLGNSYSYTHSFIFFVLNFYHEPYYPQRSNFSIVSICQRPEWKQKKRKWRRRVIF